MGMSKERFEKIKNAKCGMSCDDCELSDCCYSIQELIDEIEALQQENEQYKERLKEIETTAKAIIRDKTEPDKVMIMAEGIEKICSIVGEKITKRLVYRNRELQQENEQLKNENAVMKETLIQAMDAIDYLIRHYTGPAVDLVKYAEVLEVIKKAIGGDQNG